MSDGRIVIQIPGQPFAKARARFTKGGRTYADPKSRTNQEKLAGYFRAAIKTPYPTNVAVHAIFYRSTKGRIDVDNLMKAVMDAATGIAWEDDSQVTYMTARLEFDRENPRTDVIFDEDLESSMPRGRSLDTVGECEGCGKSFTYRAYPSRPSVQFCSRECYRLMGRGSADCEECGTTFPKRSAAQRFCSQGCGYENRKARAHANHPHCRTCGIKLARKNAVLCRECWLRQPNKTKRKSDFLDDAA